MQTKSINTKVFILFCLMLMVSCKTYTLRDLEYDNYELVKARDSKSPNYKTFKARTVENLHGFTITQDPEVGQYGGWKTEQYTATGFFRTEKIDGRWWIIDPDGYPFIHRGVNVFRPDRIKSSQTVFLEKYGSETQWIETETDFFKSYGFNGAGFWSNTDLIKNSSNPLIYTLQVNPMALYRSKQFKKNREKYEEAGSSLYRYDLVMVFDPEFDFFVDSLFSQVANYANDKNLLGYFTDNELPWKVDALDRHLKFLGEDEPGYLAAKKWLIDRKGKNATLSNVNSTDRKDFLKFYFETYMKKVSNSLKKYDPNHLNLGCRFNMPYHELSSPEMFSIAGKYMDIISINHYFKWEPEQELMKNWENWAGKPFIITEFYTKGEDTGLSNILGAGWIVPKQIDRGYFYQNFTIELLKSKVCVGWHWFRYQDEKYANKGLVGLDFVPHQPVFENAKVVNKNTYQLIKFFDK